MIEESVFPLEYAVNQGPPDFRYESRLVGLSRYQLRITRSAEGHTDNVPFALRDFLHVPESSLDWGAPFGFPPRRISSELVLRV